MLDILFYIFTALTLGAAVLVVLNKNPVNAAMFLIVSFIGMAALFVLLQAFFLAALQVLVYAGAVVVLFLFIIMLTSQEERRHVHRGVVTSAASFVALALLLTGVGSLLIFSSGSLAPGTLTTTPVVGDQPREYGYYLFSTYMLPFQVAGFLLLVAMIGVIVLGKRDEKAAGQLAEEEA